MSATEHLYLDALKLHGDSTELSRKSISDTVGSVDSCACFTLAAVSLANAATIADWRPDTRLVVRACELVDDCKVEIERLVTFPIDQ